MYTLFGIFRVGPHVGEIPGALAEAVIFVDERPVFAAVVAAIQSALFRFDEGVDHVGIFSGNAHANAAQRAFGHAVAFDTLPGSAVVIRTEQAIFFAAAVQHPRCAIALPHGREKHVWIVRIENDINAAGTIVKIKNLFPIFSAIARAKNSALGIGSVGVAQRGYKNDVWIRRMHDQLADVPRIFQPDIRPGLAAVVRTIDAIAKGNISADAGLAGAGINNIGIGFGNSNGADGRNTLLIEKRIPGNAAIIGFPDSAGDCAHVVGVGLAGDAGTAKARPPRNGPIRRHFIPL